MRPVPHEASVNQVNYKYYEPKENSDGAIKGVMYEKYDKKTGENKLKSGSNALEKLLMKARGYTALKESSAKEFLSLGSVYYFCLNSLFGKIIFELEFRATSVN